MSFGGPDTDAASRAAKEEQKKIEADKAIQKQLDESKMLANKRDQAASEAATLLRQSKLFTSETENNKKSTLLGG